MVKILCHKNNLREKLLEVCDWKIKSSEIKNIQGFFKDYELGKVTGKRGNNPEGSLLRNVYFLKIGLENIQGETIKDLENFLERLLKDKIRAHNPKTKKYDGLAYALRSKKSILQMLSMYLKWKGKENITKILNLDIKTKKQDFDILTTEEINKLIDATKEPDKRYLISVLSSSGLRAEEFHNIRFQDLTLPKDKEVFVKINVKHDYSKSQGRNICLYDKHCLPIVKDYLSLRINQGIKPNEPIFPLGYNGVRKWLNRLGIKVLNKKVHYHLFRHSSATRLASQMNRQQLCIYFGWEFSSPMPDIYIKRAGVNMDDVSEKFASTQVEDLQKEIVELKRGIEFISNNFEMRLDLVLRSIQEKNHKVIREMADNLKKERNKIINHNK